jgi:hypothetical protein
MTFKEDFPLLEGKGFEEKNGKLMLIGKKELQEFCLDKSKVRERDYELIRRLANGILAYPAKNIPRDLIKDYFDERLKELGLTSEELKEVLNG